ncbi:MAG: hypothetical protein KGI33_11880, partial [Thaumarchaeota archaeon]|nr:hypothetical protein [Nitrososphaerota archaeon]
MSILLLSSVAIVLPYAMPSAHAQVASHPNLFVSAENSQYNNYFAGPQVIQVVVSDPNINRLDQAYGEPVVTVSGKRLRMAQGTDGNWYGYFADRNQAEQAAKTAPVAGNGLNFGYFCGPTTDVSSLRAGMSFTDTKGFTIARNQIGSGNNTGAYSSSQAEPASPFQSGFPTGSLNNVCTLSRTPATSNTPAVENVIRENKTLNSNPSGYAANAKLESVWPIIQLYDFSGFPQTVVVDYQAAGGDQVVNLTFDRIPSNLISVTPDRTAYPQNTQVFLTMNDPQLNVDPTEDDVWTWGANASNNTLYYQAFDRNANPRADGVVSTSTTAMPGSTVGTPAMQNLIGNLTNFMFNHNGKFTLNPTAQSNRVVDFQNFGRQQLVCNSGLAAQCDTTTRGSPSQVQDKGLNLAKGSEMISFAEQGGVNTGVFGDWDGARTAGIITLSPSEESGYTIGTATYPAAGSIRGQSATFRYNDISGSIVGGFAFGSITMTTTNNTWASGQRIPVTLTDMDENKNSKITEHLNVYDPKVDRITTMKIGTPFSLNAQNPTANPTGPETAMFTDYKVVLSGKVNGTGRAPAQYTTSSFGDNTTSTNIAVDEGFSARPIFQFSNQTIVNGTMMVVDTKTTMATLLNTINNPVGSTSGKFKGFDFINYDLRSFSTLNGATGSPITSMNIYLVNSSQPLSTSTDAFGTVKPTFTSIANNTSLQGFVNLNGTQVTPGGKAVDVTGSQANQLNILKSIFSIPKTNYVGLAFQFVTSDGGSAVVNSLGEPVMADFFSVGITGDGTDNSQRINNGIYRWELEETGDNTGVFTGTNQFTMLNQLSIFDPATYSGLRTINHDVLFVAIQDMLASEARAPQATYLDLGADGVNTQISAQQDIPTHSGTVSFDQKTYKVGDTVTITVNDPDLNTNNDLVVIYTAVKATTPLGTAQDPSTDTIGLTGLGTYSDGRAIGRMLDVQFGQTDIRWSDANIPNVNPNTTPCWATDSNTATPGGFASSLAASGFSLVETSAGSGVFTGTFEVPDKICQSGTIVGTNGQNMKVNYVDFRDESGKLVEVSDNAGIRGNTGSVKLDKSVYPVPFGTISTTNAGANFDPTTSGVATASSLNGVFPLHRDLSGSGLLPTTGNYNGVSLVLPAGNVIVHARVNDPDYTTAASGTNFIAVGVWYANSHTNVNNGPVAFQISRQGQSMLLATAGGPAKHGGHIINLNGTQLPAVNATAWSYVPDLGPMAEISPGAGIFQADLPIELTDGPAGTDCPVVTNWDQGINGTGFTTNMTPNGANGGTAASHQGGRFWSAPASGTGNYCVRQGDVLTVTYYDTADASGNPQTVTDSATFDLRNGVLQSDKSVYIIG